MGEFLLFIRFVLKYSFINALMVPTIMVRVNLINPELLADQHLVAEYNEMLMLVSYIRRYPELDSIPAGYTLGKGHMRFFKDKVLYLKKRHELIKAEMRGRGFATNKSIVLKGFPRQMLNDYKPSKAEKDIIKKRLIEKLRLKPDYYRYYGKAASTRFLSGQVHMG